MDNVVQHPGSGAIRNPLRHTVRTGEAAHDPWLSVDVQSLVHLRNALNREGRAGIEGSADRAPVRAAAVRSYAPMRRPA